MAAIKTDFGAGGANLAPGGAAGSPDLATALRDMADDLAALRTAHNALLAKLDADAANTALNDTDYAATLTVAALKTTKA